MKEFSEKKIRISLSKRNILLLTLQLIFTFVAIFSGVVIRDYLLISFVNSKNNKVEAIVLEGESMSIEPNSTAKFFLKAFPQGENNQLASIRMDFTNATIVDFQAEQDYLAVGVCENGEIFQENKLCVDLGKTTGDISKDEKLGEVTLMFGNTTGFSVVTASGNGFYNGQLLDRNENSALNYDGFSTLPLTGDEEAIQFDIANYPTFLIIGGVIFIGCLIGLIYLVMQKSSKNHKPQIGKIVNISGIILLAGSTMIISGYLQNTKNQVETSEAFAANECQLLKNDNAVWAGSGNYCSRTTAGLLLTCTKDGIVSNRIQCQNGCQIAPMGTDDSCKESPAFACLIYKTAKELNKVNYKVSPEAIYAILQGETRITCGTTSRTECIGDANQISAIRPGFSFATLPYKIKLAYPGDDGIGISQACSWRFYDDIPKFISTADMLQCMSVIGVSVNDSNPLIKDPASSSTITRLRVGDTLCYIGLLMKYYNTNFSEAYRYDSAKFYNFAVYYNKNLENSKGYLPYFTQAKTKNIFATCGTNPPISPINTPTITPTKKPTITPTKIPSSPPTKLPSYPPTKQPTLSPTSPPGGEGVVCNALDIDGNNILNYVDLYAFNKFYNKRCINYVPLLPQLNCGYQDTNGDKIINYLDLSYLFMNYYPRTRDCRFGKPG